MEFEAHVHRIVQSCTTIWSKDAAAAATSTITSTPTAATTYTSSSSSSSIPMPFAPSSNVQAIIGDVAALRPHIYHSFHTALRAFTAKFGHLDCEHRITLVLEWATSRPLPSRGFSITTYTEPLPNPPAAPVEVKIGRAPPSRHGKVAKDAQVCE